MSKNEETYNQQDLFPSGKAYRNSIFGPGESSLPNVSNPYSSFPPSGNFGGNLPVPYQPPAQQASSFLGNLPIKDISAFVNRMGGIDGIMSMLNKVNAMFKSVQQMTPMIKLLMGSFSKAKTADAAPPALRRRRRRRRRSTSSFKSKSRIKK